MDPLISSNLKVDGSCVLIVFLLAVKKTLDWGEERFILAHRFRGSSPSWWRRHDGKHSGPYRREYELAALHILDLKAENTDKNQQWVEPSGPILVTHCHQLGLRPPLGTKCSNYVSHGRTFHSLSRPCYDCLGIYIRPRKKVYRLSVSFPQTPSSTSNTRGLNKTAHSDCCCDPTAHTSPHPLPVVMESILFLSLLYWVSWASNGSFHY